LSILIKYEIHRGETLGVKPKPKIGSVAGSIKNYNDTSVTIGVTYFYYVT